MRKVAEAIVLGAGMPRAKGEKQLLARRAIQVQPAWFQRHLGGKARGSSGVRGGRGPKILEGLGVRRRKRV